MFTRALALSALLMASPALSFAGTSAYPNLDEVLNSTAISGPVDQVQLIQDVLAASTTPTELRAYEVELQQRFPNATTAEIADIMVAAYSDGLAENAGTLNVQRSVSDFEAAVYSDLFASSDINDVTVPADTPDGWLYNPAGT